MAQRITTHTFTLAGHTITLEQGECALQAESAVVLRTGKAVLLATVVTNPAEEVLNFLPLTVDYQESFAGAGRIPGGFLRRESRPGEAEVLIARKTDRVLRPRFAHGFCDTVQVRVSLLSVDPHVHADTFVPLAASAALGFTDIPFAGPVSIVRVARIAGAHVVNPSPEACLAADLNMVVGGDQEGNVLMLEGDMHELPEAAMAEAIQVAQEAIRTACAAQQTFLQQRGKGSIAVAEPPANTVAPAIEALESHFYTQCSGVVSQALSTKKQRDQAFDQLLADYLAAKPQEGEEAPIPAVVAHHFKAAKQRAIRDKVLQEGMRLDGRTPTDIRPITSKIDYLPSTHGSALFTRGETQALATVTLGSRLDEQLIDSPTASGTKSLMLHYNFPGFSTGESKPLRGPGRRELGHGNLALHGIKPVLPAPLPCTLRMVCDILSSNGSSSMATVCAISQALMDAGIGVERPVAGIAMGIMADPEERQHVILSDILGEEDYMGGADFKVTGTTEGITACQMDIKLTKGLPYEVLLQALEQARQGRLHILGEMAKTIDTPRTTYKPHTPRTERLEIPKDAIGSVIGPGGKVIQELQRKCNTRINITEQQGHGQVEIFAPDQEALEATLKAIHLLVDGPTVGATYTGRIKSVVDFGAFIEFIPGKDGLLHKSEIMHDHIPNPYDHFEVGQEVTVKLIDIQAKTGRFSLSQKALTASS